jgi:hypothetical protein
MSSYTGSYYSDDAQTPKISVLSLGLHAVDGLLLDSIDEVFLQLLGEQVRRTIYECLEREGLHRHRIPEYLLRFDNFLERNFGRSARVIERQIARRLYRLLGLELVENPHYTLTDYFDIATNQPLGPFRGLI